MEFVVYFVWPAVALGAVLVLGYRSLQLKVDKASRKPAEHREAPAE